MPAHLRKMPTLREYAVDFLSQVAFMPKLKTRLYYANGCRLLNAQPIAGMRIDQITNREAVRLEISGSGSNANNALRVLKRMLNLAWEEGLLPRQPKITLRPEKERSAVYSPEEEACFLSKAGQPLGDIALLIFDAGFRPCEAIALPWKNVDFVRRAVYLEGGKSKKADRWIPLSDRLYGALIERAKSQKPGTVWLFPADGNKNGRTTKSGHIENYTKTFRRAAKRAGLPGSLVLYSARHTLATNLCESTGNPKLVQSMVGHTRISTTMRYIHTGMAEGVIAVNQINRDRAIAVQDAKTQNLTQ